MALRYRRVNIDGKSLFKTETRLMTNDDLPGTFVKISQTTNRFVDALSTDIGTAQIYVLDVDHASGQTISEPVKTGTSGIGNYAEEGREFALLFASGAVSVKDKPVYIGAGGQATFTDPGEGVIIGFSQDAVTLTQDDFIRVRLT